MINIYTVLLLGLVQGITEFLPISSSGHLAIIRHIFKIQENGVAIDTAFHFGTLFSILFVFREKIINLIKESFNKDQEIKNNPLFLIILGIIPAGLFGVLFEKRIGSFFESPKTIVIFIGITGLILLSTKFSKNKNNPINIKNALIIGVFQIFALLPGISRAGTTISCALNLGIDRKESADFSFFMCIPLLLGAGLLEFHDLLKLSMHELKLVLVGVFVSFLSGILALKILYKILSNQKFYMFSWYCFIVSLLGFVLL